MPSKLTLQPQSDFPVDWQSFFQSTVYQVLLTPLFLQSSSLRPLIEHFVKYQIGEVEGLYRHMVVNPSYLTSKFYTYYTNPQQVPSYASTFKRLEIRKESNIDADFSNVSNVAALEAQARYLKRHMLTSTLTS